MPLSSAEDCFLGNVIEEEIQELGKSDVDESTTDTEDYEEEELRELLEMYSEIKCNHVSVDISAVAEDLEKRIKLNSNMNNLTEYPLKYHQLKELKKISKKEDEDL